eukprot:Em0009g518a
MFHLPCLLQSSTRSHWLSCTTLSTRCGMNTKGAPFISSPPDGIVTENGAISPLRLSPTIWLEMWRILSSPARQMPDDLSHLKH